MPPLFVTSSYLSIAAGILSSCSHFTMVSTTSVGLDVSGDVSNVPDHVSIGFRRREVLFEKPGTQTGASSLATLDATATWNRGHAIRQTSATGRAAEIVANDFKEPNNPAGTESAATDQPLTFLTRTTVGISAS